MLVSITSRLAQILLPDFGDLFYVSRLETSLVLLLTFQAPLVHVPLELIVRFTKGCQPNGILVLRTRKNRPVALPLLSRVVALTKINTWGNSVTHLY